MLGLRFSLFRRVAGYLRDLAPDDLLKAMYRQALLDLAPFVRGGEVVGDWQTAPVQCKARALSAALFLADEIPAARRVVRRLLGSFREDEAEELLLFARFGDYPWREEIGRTVCFRCGRKAVWRSLFSPPDTIPAAYHWRYDIPENHAPLCHVCANYTLHGKDDDIRRLWGRAVWGVRFDAWDRLHLAFSRGKIPQWDKEAFPLWPPSYGGDTWASGAGVLLARYPRLHSVKRLAIHRDAARALLERFRLVRHRLRERSLLLRVAYPNSRSNRKPSARSRHA